MTSVSSKRILDLSNCAKEISENLNIIKKRSFPELRILKVNIGDLKCLQQMKIPFAELEGLAIQGNVYKQPDILSDFLNLLSKLRNLRMLAFIDTRLRVLPGIIGSFNMLEKLYLPGNRFKELPHDLWELPSLKKVSINSNLINCVPRYVLLERKVSNREVLNYLLARVNKIKWNDGFNKLNSPILREISISGDCEWINGVGWKQKFATKSIQVTMRDINCSDTVFSDLIRRFGCTLLREVSAVGRVHLASWLIGSGVNVNGKELGGETPLHVSVRNKCFDVLKLLVEKGADVNIRNNEGVTPLMLAAEQGNLKFVQYLVNNGAIPEIEDNNGWIAWSFASVFGHREVIDFLENQPLISQNLL